MAECKKIINEWVKYREQFSSKKKCVEEALEPLLSVRSSQSNCLMEKRKNAVDPEKRLKFICFDINSIFVFANSEFFLERHYCHRCIPNVFFVRFGLFVLCTFISEFIRTSVYAILVTTMIDRFFSTSRKSKVCMMKYGELDYCE